MKTLLTLIIALSAWVEVFGFDDQRAGFIIEIRGEQNPYRIFSVFVMPGEAVSINSESNIRISSNDLNVNGTNLTSPDKPGAYKLEVRTDQGDLMTVNVLVMTPMTNKKGEYLNGYRIGNYPSKPLNGNPIYNKPRGLFEVTEQNASLKLTPHFTLQQFLCKQSGNYPKYLIVRERLLLKLEYLLEKANNEGYSIETFGFISGYRTPYYNKSIKNVQYSRHVWGGAADIFIDQDKNGSMDDLNHDGTIDEKDVRIFYQIVDSEYDKKDYHKFRGGLGFYKKNKSHNGFIHVDVRGWKARW